jgi:hypothetical protein
MLSVLEQANGAQQAVVNQLMTPSTLLPEFEIKMHAVCRLGTCSYTI